jgi:hypothetical protein
MRSLQEISEVLVEGHSNEETISQITGFGRYSDVLGGICGGPCVLCEKRDVAGDDAGIAAGFD